jgi:hypothetical protein
MNNIFYNPRTGYWYIRNLNIAFISEYEAIEYLNETFGTLWPKVSHNI